MTAATFRPGARISGGTRDISQALEGMRRAREVMALPGLKPADDLTRDFMYACSMRDMVELYAEAHGFAEVAAMPLQRAIGALINISDAIRKGQRDFPHDTETFTDILANQKDKALLRGWENADHSWRRVARVSELQSFKQSSRVALSEMLLAKVPANGEIKEHLRNDRAEYIQASTYAATFNTTMEALTNDDLEVLVRLPYEAGIAASATVNKLFWEYVTTAAGVGPTLNQTGRALFNSTDGNYTSSGAAPDLAGLNVARKALRKMTDPVTARRLNIPAKYLVVPPELEATARVLAAADRLEGSAENLEVVVEAALSDATNGTTAWYLFADGVARFDTFDVGFIGDARPHVESKKGWEVDGLRNKVRIDFGLCALDFRGVYRNKGA